MLGIYDSKYISVLEAEVERLRERETGLLRTLMAQQNLPDHLNSNVKVTMKPLNRKRWPVVKRAFETFRAKASNG